ncbi:MAG: hypothetical protein H5T84_01015, partial [Thermoleophilia bacterium]|nr:hypothetical protein [Thermoleophilia bacterium]
MQVSNAKLSLRLDEELIRSAKRHSARTGKSVSRLVADYFALIEARDAGAPTKLTPRVRSLVGVLFDTNVVLDVLLAREPYVDVAAQLFTLVDTGAIEG